MFGEFDISFIEYRSHVINFDCYLFIVGLGLQKIFLAPRNLKNLFRFVSYVVLYQPFKLVLITYQLVKKIIYCVNNILFV